jgi:hypothetical protein
VRNALVGAKTVKNKGKRIDNNPSISKQQKSKHQLAGAFPEERNLFVLDEVKLMLLSSRLKLRFSAVKPILVSASAS